MPEYRLEIASRYLRRQFEKAVGRSIPKIIAELVTNSDDSYRRLAKQAEGTPKYSSLVSEPLPIIIVFDRSKRKFQVIDHAEGLSDDDMLDRFITYGKESPDRAFGIRTRSLFGKGLRDVLFTQKYGQVKSIRQERLYTCRFRWKKDKGSEYPVVEIKPPARLTRELRDALQIPENGTFVEFILADGVPAPQHDKLTEKLANFYMLRMINSSPHREVILRTVHAKGKVMETQLSSGLPEGELVQKVQGVFVTEEGQEIRAEGEIRLSTEPLTQGEAGYEDRRGGILILDEDDAALDLTLLGFDENPNARRIFGQLRLEGAGEYIRRKLNQEAPEEILTETREGFDKKHPFFKALGEFVLPYLEPIVERETQELSSGKSALSEQTRSRHRKAFEILNKLYKEMLGKTARIPVVPGTKLIPPEEGIAFVNEVLSVQRGVETPAALLVNSRLVGAEEPIEVVTETEGIEVKPNRLLLGPQADPGTAAVKIVRVTAIRSGLVGLVTARWKDVKKELRVETTEREVVTPVDGLEFEREEYAVRVGARRTLKLFVDVTKIQLGSSVVVTVDSSSLKLGDGALVVSRENLITDSVAELRPSVSGQSLAPKAIVTASCLSYVTSTSVSVVKQEPKPEGLEGFFKDYEFRALDRKVQTLFDPRGIILINTKDPVNSRYFGDTPYAAVESLTHCQVRLADLVLNECLQIMVTKALEDGRLDRHFPDNPEIDVWNYVNEKKFEIGPLIHTQFVTSV